MEWVETTARSIEEAKDAALDQLGVDEQEAEFEIVEEPRAGLFGRVRGEARVRARVAPKAPRPRQERRPRGRRTDQAATGNPGASGPAAPNDEVTTESPPRERPGRRDRPSSGRGAKRTPDRPRSGTDDGKARREMDDTIVSTGEQADIISGFLSGLLDAFGLAGELRRSEVDDETVEIDVDGDDLGLLIGPKGQTLTAVHELSRTVLQRQATGRYEGRVRIDVSGYRTRRREALARFASQVAEQVRESGMQKALEPMGSADRKVVHDTVNEIDDVSTLSEGQEPRRRVVIIPGSGS